MSEFDYDEHYDAPKALRDHAKSLEKQLADLQKKLDGVAQENADLKGQVKKTSLADLLKEAGIDPKFASRADKDGAEPTADGVKAWIDENRDFYNFGAPKTEEATAAEAEQEQAGQPTIPDGMEQAVRAGQSLDASGVAPSEVNVMDKLQAIDPSKFETREELEAAIAAAGVKFD